ncbi:MAG: CHRD domain-containing protein, partial [Usitatibacteraceae bacterium]
MKRILLLIAMAALATLQAHAQTGSAITYVTALNGAAEAPANTSPAIGSATVIYEPATKILTISVQFSGLLGTTTAAHIHCCTAVAGAGTVGVATTTPTFSGFPGSVTAGTYLQPLNMASASSYNTAFISSHGGTPDTALSALLEGMAAGKAYLDIHSSFFPGGEIRGFPVPPTLTGVVSRKVHGATGSFDIPLDTSQPFNGTVSV